MSFLRSLVELFIPAHSAKRLSLLTRVFTSTMLMIIPVVTQTLFKGQKIFVTLLILIITLLLLYMYSNLKKVLKGLTLFLVFIAVGFAVTIISKFLGYPTPTATELILSSANLTALFLAVSLFFQWLSLRELRWILAKLGMSKLASLVTATLALLPLLFNNYAEAYTATLTKFSSKRKVYKAINALIIHSVIIANDIAQAIYLYGLPQISKVKVELPKPVELVLMAVITITTILLLVAAP
ncbi:MAG: hypothetical protein LM572_02565 [Ignisphaera sp.]|nr:hypothetical protein [Ignisphaera sp.]MCC6055364.1 hypothetical protein [Desulfurococcaceae archaeon]